VQRFQHTLFVAGLWVLNLVPAVLAVRVVSDRIDGLELQEQALPWEARQCGDHTLANVGQARFLGDRLEQAIPYMSYNIALPAGAARPIVTVQDSILEPFVGSLASLANCDTGQAFVAKPVPTTLGGIQYSSVIARDGLAQIRISIPVLIRNGSSWSVRTSFRVRVSWNAPTTASAGSLGKRALADVINPQGAQRFAQKIAHKPLRRVAGDIPTGTEWLASIPIGDRDLATFKEDGVYQLSFAQMKQAFAAQSVSSLLDGIPVKRLLMCAGSADTLREVPSTATAQLGILQELPITILDHSSLTNMTPDSTWDEGDTLVFFASGTSLWKRMDLENPTLSVPGMEYYFSSNPYSFTRNFYLGVLPEGKSGKRLATLATRSGGTSVSSITRYVRAERDLMLRDANFGPTSSGFEDNTGREWFWIWGSTFRDSLQVSADEITMPQVASLPGLQGDSAKVAVAFFPYRSTEASGSVGAVPPSQIVSQKLSGSSLDERYSGLKFVFIANGDTANSLKIRQPLGQFVCSLKGLTKTGNRYSMRIGPNGMMYDRFDGYSIAYPLAPQWLDSNETWLPGSLNGVRAFSFANAPANLQVLKLQGDFPVGFIPQQNGAFVDSLAPAMDVRYHLFKTGSYRAVTTILPWLPETGRITDLTNLSGQYDYVIVVPRAWVPAAMELAKFRSGGTARDIIRTAVVDVEDIWQQYGSGAPSPMAIRDFLRMARESWSDLRYVVMVGSGHADMRLIRSSSPEVVMPLFEKEDQGNNDYFGILDSGEAMFYGKYSRDLIVGRLPFSSVSQLTAYVRKIKQQEELTQQDNGNWRNTILMTADDDRQREHIDKVQDHTGQAERILKTLSQNASADGYQIDMQRLYLLTYEANSAYQKPEAARDLISRINQGALFTVWFGHGSSVDWADEGLLQPIALTELINKGRYTILGSFACTVGRFDIPGSPSLSEFFVEAVDKGAIAAIGSMRESYPSQNESFASKVLVQSTIGEAGTLGEAYHRAKGVGLDSFSSQRYNDEKYVLIGEPVLALPLVSAQVQLDQKIDTLQALQHVVLSGKVKKAPSSGKVFLEVLQGPELRVLIGNYGTKPDGDPDNVYDSTHYQGRMIYSEVLPYNKGKFSTDFVMPRKINFGDTAVQIRLWAWSPGDTTLGRGLYQNIRIDGTSNYQDSIHDTIPPSIGFRPCGLPDSLSRNYSLSKPLQLEIPACVEVIVKDSTGIDLREQPDEGVSFEIKDFKAPWHPWPFIEQSGKRVVGRMDFTTKWNPGSYLFRVQAQDILGNQNVQEISVQLNAGLTQGLSGVFNAPNPMKKITTFYFRNLAENYSSQVSIEIYGMDGRLVKVFRNAISGSTQWDGKDQRGRMLANGLYYYVVTSVVYTTASDGSKKVKRFQEKQKLVISR